jgi:hypothetical protein
MSRGLAICTAASHLGAVHAIAAKPSPAVTTSDDATLAPMTRGRGLS